MRSVSLPVHAARHDTVTASVPSWRSLTCSLGGPATGCTVPVAPGGAGFVTAGGPGCGSLGVLVGGGAGGVTRGSALALMSCGCGALSDGQSVDAGTLSADSTEKARSPQASPRSSNASAGEKGMAPAPRVDP